MQDRRQARGHPWHGIRTKQRVLKQVRGHPSLRVCPVTSIWVQKRMQCSFASISFKKNVNERLRAIKNRFLGGEMEGIDNQSLVW